MNRLNKSLKKIAMTPGSVVYTGDNRSNLTTIKLIKYDREELEETYIEDLDEIDWTSKGVKWLNVVGINNTLPIKKMGRRSNISGLVLEDIVHTGQRPKIDFYDDHVFVILKMLTMDENTIKVKQEQISFILKSDTLLSFQEEKEDVFDPVRKRIYDHLGVIRKKGADYLLYCLIDAIVDNYYVLLDKIDSKLDALENEMINHSRTFSLDALYHLRRELMTLKTSIWPTKDIIQAMLKKKEPLILESTKEYLSDVNDHIDEIMDYINMFREMIGNLFDTHLSMSSNRMNQIMTTLTIFSAIFIPLTFLAGVYGMNFHYMPELAFKWGYPIYWVISIVVAFGMYVFFKKKGWI